MKISDNIDEGMQHIHI